MEPKPKKPAVNNQLHSDAAWEYLLCKWNYVEGNKHDLKKSELCHNLMQMSVTVCEGMDKAQPSTVQHALLTFTGSLLASVVQILL